MEEKRKPVYEVLVRIGFGKSEKLAKIGAAWENQSKKGRKYFTLSLNQLYLFPKEPRK